MSALSETSTSRIAHWLCGKYMLDVGEGAAPLIMGIVNVTPDSFSDGGTHMTTESAIAWGKRLIAEGAHILDIGGESTRPGARPVPPSEEAARVIPVLEALSDLGVPLSVDTRHPTVAAAAVAAGASIINDIGGFSDPAMLEVATSCEAGLVAMHMQGLPESMQHNPHYHDVVDEVARFLAHQASCLQDAGVAAERICLDPGFGFGKTFEHNLALIGATEQICALGYPVLVGVSRKTFVGRLCGQEIPAERDAVSAEIALDLVARGASIVRVHNVSATRAALGGVCVGGLREDGLNAGESHDSAVGVGGLPEVTAYVALGSNMGEREEYLRAAAGAISELPCTRATCASSIYESQAAYKTDQRAFANAVIEVRTSLGLYAFFAELQNIEHRMGRVKTEVNGARNIDVDLLLYADAQVDTALLTVPHPRLVERAFTVVPLVEIAPALALPDGRTLDVDAAKVGPLRGKLAGALLR